MRLFSSITLLIVTLPRKTSILPRPWTACCQTSTDSLSRQRDSASRACQMRRGAAIESARRQLMDLNYTGTLQVNLWLIAVLLLFAFAIVKWTQK